MNIQSFVSFDLHTSHDQAFEIIYQTLLKVSIESNEETSTLRRTQFNHQFTYFILYHCHEFRDRIVFQQKMQRVFNNYLQIH